ncbi:YwqG family protein [Patulibacter sp. SYSU D01012]|uniref:DUF1963 domain-containing protein n=1 Tax=Patulibacter sp. SYSU D01012 TaxID=2817381 RepID=UPI001B31294D|nr:YwqG family protein [Patulibacter sp. SYSU D01012]
MGLFDRLRRRDPAPSAADDGVGRDVFAELRTLARAGATPDAQRAAVARALQAHGLPAALAGRYVDRMVDGIALSPDGATDPRLRIGGDPLLPPDEPWPHAPDGRPLSFVAALDLAAVPPLAPLPRAGVLLVFWDTAFHELERMDFVAATRVFLVPPEHAPVPAATPDGAERAAGVPQAATVVPFPAPDATLDTDDVPDGVPAYELDDALQQEYGDRLLGAERPIQGPVLDEVPYWLVQGFPATRERYSAAELAGEGWAFLAQLGEPDGLRFGDVGALYLVLPRADLQAGRFDRVMGILQS